MTKILLPLAALAMIAAPMAANAATCRDAHGRFAPCAAAAAKPAAKVQHTAARPAAHPVAQRPVAANAAKTPAKRCKIGGKFASCSAPGARPI